MKILKRDEAQEIANSLAEYAAQRLLSTGLEARVVKEAFENAAEKVGLWRQAQSDTDKSIV